MKFWRALGGVLCFIGCLAALVGLLATALPIIDNGQIQRIIDSFSVQTQDRIINAVNAAILFCLHNNYLVFGIGAGVLLLGGLMKTIAGGVLYERYRSRAHSASAAPEATAKRAAPAAEPAERPTTAPVAAYTPGAEAGLSPYAAAEYGKALTGGARGSQASEIAKKYMPRSIISSEEFARPEEPPAQPEMLAPLSTEARPAAAPEVTETEAPASEPGATVLCPVCGTENPAHLSFCGECGGKLPVRAASDGVAAAARETKARVQAETREDMQAEELATVQNRRTGHLPRVEPDFEPIFSADGETAGWSYTDTAEPNPSAYEAAEEGTQPSGAAPETPVAARAAYLASPEDGARESETPYAAYPRDSQAGYEEGAAKAVWDERPNVIARATRTVRLEAAASAEPEAAGWHGNAAAGYDREPDDRSATGAYRATGRAHPQAASQSEYWATEPHAAQARATAQTAAHSAAANRPAEAPGRASFADRAGWGASGEPAAPTRPEMSRTTAAAAVAAAETPTPPAAGVRADRDAATGPNAGRTDPGPAMAQMARATETLAAPPHRPQSLPDERPVRAVAAVPAWGEGTAAPLRPPISGFDHGATATMAQPAKASSPRADEKASPVSGMAGKGRGQPHIVTTIQQPAMETATAPDPGTGPSTAASDAVTPTDERAGLAPARTPATPRPRIVSTMGKNRT